MISNLSKVEAEKLVIPPIEKDVQTAEICWTVQLINRVDWFGWCQKKEYSN